jgi:hypothetical protein
MCHCFNTKRHCVQIEATYFCIGLICEQNVYCCKFNSRHSLFVCCCFVFVFLPLAVVRQIRAWFEINCKELHSRVLSFCWFFFVLVCTFSLHNAQWLHYHKTILSRLFFLLPFFFIFFTSHKLRCIIIPRLKPRSIFSVFQTSFIVILLLYLWLYFNVKFYSYCIFVHIHRLNSSYFFTLYYMYYNTVVVLTLCSIVCWFFCLPCDVLSVNCILSSNCVYPLNCNNYITQERARTSQNIRIFHFLAKIDVIEPCVSVLSLCCLCACKAA